ncbi:MAG: thioredoxin family protein [Caulobacteraceae bacterium]|nr:thioredoxin family protein [Caulobacteraceae bacterium]
MDRFRALIVALAICLGLTAPALAQVGPSPHAKVRMVADAKAAAPGSTLWVAVVLDQDAGWHTYWRNPGDAGEATEIAWTLPDGWRAGGIVWPTPRRLPLGPIMNYGYEGRAVLPVPVSVPASARPGAPAHLTAKVDYLICAEVCVPGEAVTQLDLPVTSGPAPADPEGHALIQSALSSTPRTGVVNATFQASRGSVRLSAAAPALANANVASAYFFPYDSSAIDQAKPQSVERGPRGLTLTLVPGAAFTGKTPSQLAGALMIDGQGYDLAARAGPPLPGTAGHVALASASAQTGQLGLWLATAYAFVGGLILNLMPCVFPILSMKATALAGHSEDHTQARTQALAFLGGVLASFLVLAGALLALRAAGSAVGWGFQLQSPTLVALLALVMLAAALNLSGLFEIGTSLQGLGGGLAARGGAIGAVFTGVLAVVVAAPCTAPFMGPALGYALTQPPAFALAVFLALGLGFAAPFTIVAFTPALIRLLPRPGAWMSVFRKAMAFPMYAAAAWLAWVLAQQSGAVGLARLLAAAVVLALAAWLFGLSQERRAAGGHAPALGGAAFVTLVGAGLVAAAPLGASALTSQPWSPQAVVQARAAGHPVLVNFTAAWCVTCQVNERVAFSNPSVARAFHRANAVYLVGDWTNKDAAIGQALQAQGRIGVPLYLLYDAKGDAPTVLPQLLTPQSVTRALEQASSGKA